MKYRIVRRWYTVQDVEADSEDEAIEKAKESVLLHEDFNEEDYEVVHTVHTVVKE
jgi:hypothetical protein